MKKDKGRERVQDGGRGALEKYLSVFLSLPQTGHTMDRAKGPAKHAGPTARPMTTGMLSRSRQEHYTPRRESRDTCAAETGAHLLRES